MWTGYVFLLFSESLSNAKKENNQTIFLLVLPIISSHLLRVVSFESYFDDFLRMSLAQNNIADTADDHHHGSEFTMGNYLFCIHTWP